MNGFNVWWEENARVHFHKRSCLGVLSLTFYLGKLGGAYKWLKKFLVLSS